MSPKNLLDLKSFEELRDEATQKLKDEGFRIRNFRPGRVFYTLMELLLIAVSTLYTLLGNVIMNTFVSHAQRDWLDISALHHSGAIRKEATETQGVIKVGRDDPSIQATFQEGDMVTTEEDEDGEVLRYIVTERTVLSVGQEEAEVPVKAELPGAGYNVSAGKITRLATFHVGIDWVTNEEGWITHEGTDREDDESLRRRSQARYIGLSLGGTREMYQALAEEVDGVGRARVDTDHPRGEGTIDVIIIGTEGVPSSGVVDNVQAKLEAEGSAIADILVSPVEALIVDINATLYIDDRYGDEEKIEQEATSIIQDMFSLAPVDDVEQLNLEYGVDRSLVIGNLRQIEHVLSVVLNNPAEDVRAEFDKLVVPGEITLEMIRETL